MALPTSFDMSFKPTTEVVSVVRRFVMSLYERILSDDEMSSQLGLVTHELLENAVKYNIDDETVLRVTLTPKADSQHSEVIVTIRTRNRATAENIRTVERLITKVKKAEDPFMFYQDLLQASVEEVGSGLGIARIRAETEMAIDLKVDGDVVEIVAQAQVNVGGAP